MTNGRRLRIVFLLLLPLLSARPPEAAAASILFVMDDVPALQALIPVLKKSFRQSSEVIPVTQSDEPVVIFSAREALAPPQEKDPGEGKDKLRLLIESPQPNLDDLCHPADVVVIAGLLAARHFPRDCPTPTLLLFTPRQQAEALMATAQRRPISAIYREADPIHQLRLIRRALPNVAKVAVLISPSTAAGLPRLQSEAKKLGFILEAIKANDDEEAVRNLRERLKDIDALFLLPDERLINAWSLKPLLLMSARHFVPVFGGLVEGYVKAGVTAAVVQDLGQVGPQLKRFIRQLAQGEAPEPAYPEATRILVNELVARTLSIPTEHWEGTDDP